MIAAIAEKCNKGFPTRNEPLPLPMFSVSCRPQGVIHIWKADGVERAVNSHSNPLVCLGHLSPSLHAYLFLFQRTKCSLASKMIIFHTWVKRKQQEFLSLRLFYFKTENKIVKEPKSFY